MDQLLPDPSDERNGYQYLCQEAAAGHFKHASDLSVMMYLWTWTFRSNSNPEGVPQGHVMSGKVKVEKIAAGTAMGYSTVKASLNRLRGGGWIQTERSTVNGGWRDTLYIFVRMDVAGHQERDRARGLAASSQEGSQIAH